MQQSDKHGPARDDRLAHEAQGADEADRAAVPEDRRGTPPGMDTGDVELRSEIAQVLGRHVYPAGRDELLVTAAENEAGDEVMGLLKKLPGDQRFVNVQEVVEALGVATESRRF